MEFRLWDEYRMLRDTIRKFRDETIQPTTDCLDPATAVHSSGTNTGR